MDPITSKGLLDGTLAVGIGLFIGLEREHRELEKREDEPDKRPVTLGVRTFALISLAGWLSRALAIEALPLVALLVIGVLLGLESRHELEANRGLTTEVAAFATFMLGMLVHDSRALAVAIALFVALLLLAKPWFRTLVPQMRRMDLTAALQLAILFAIVIPLLPEVPIDPWEAVSPRKVGIFAALVGAVSFVGYVLHRTLGDRTGAGLTGLVGGLASSTAVTVAMAQRARADDRSHSAAQLATLLACAVMYPRIAVITALINPQTALLSAPPFILMALATAVPALFKWRQLKREGGGPAGPGLEIENPFALLPALKWGVLLATSLLVAALLRSWLGETGLYLAAVLTGAFDADAMVLVVARQKTGATATLAITVALIANALVKAGISLVTGGKRYGLFVALVLATSGLIGGAAAVTMMLALAP